MLKNTRLVILFDMLVNPSFKMTTNLAKKTKTIGSTCNLISDCLDEICMCGKDIESTNHFLFQCSLFLNERQVFMNKIRDIDSSLIDQNENCLCYTLLFGKENINESKNTHVVNATIEYILATERFNVPLFE